MKPTYKNFESKKTGGFVELPPVGAYVAEIQAVRTLMWQRFRRFGRTISLIMMLWN